VQYARWEKVGNMDISLWLGVAALALAIPLGVASNLLTARVIAYLEKRKLLKSHRTKRQALVVFNRIKAFKEGKRDRYPFYMILAEFRSVLLRNRIDTHSYGQHSTRLIF
jgi:hypothetical protein